MKETMENNIAIIGDKGLVQGFAAAGFRVFSPEYEKDAIARDLEAVVKDNFSLCFILERYALKIKERIRELEEKIYPAIVILPDYREDFNLTGELLKKIVVRAIGTESIEAIQK
ncbi:MAG: V-type ATP synthase subunit F [Candidatus Omnitrophota bacterium]